MTRPFLPVQSTLRRTLCSLLMAAVVVGVAPGQATAEPRFLRLETEQLPLLGDRSVYEIWLLAGGEPISAGAFAVTADGAPERVLFRAEIPDGSTVTDVVLTIEPRPDPDPTPSLRRLLGGEVVGGQATLTVDHPQAIGRRLESAAGTFILAAPTGGSSADFRNGIWWLDPSTGPGPSLLLPDLPAGWVYEGWVTGSDGLISTGRFTAADAADDDGSGFTSGPFAPPAFPGQDFVHPAVDLTSGFTTTITVEPEPDTSRAPSGVRLLADDLIEDTGADVPQAMTNLAADLPAAQVDILEPGPTTDTAHLWLDLRELPPLGSDHRYEGWLIVDGEPVSVGTFGVSEGIPEATYFPTQVRSATAIEAFVLTIEPNPDPEPAPGPTHLLAGDLVDGHALLSVGHTRALGTSFDDAHASYILGAPTAGDDASYVNGIWWLDPAGGQALDLPSLPLGWTYEGWVGGPDGAVSTGRFTSVTGPDDDGAGPAAGGEPAPPFPGQDFIDPVRDLTAGVATSITVEPDPDTSPEPFGLRPMVDVFIDDVGGGVLQPMQPNPAPRPSGLARLLIPRVIVAGGNTPGAGDLHWLTDLDLVNVGDRPAEAIVELLPSGGGLDQVPAPARLSVQPGASVRTRDVFGSLFDFEGTGALRVLSSTGTVAAASRTFATSAGGGTFGQGIPTMDEGDLIRFGDVGRLIELSESNDPTTGARTNVGLLNATTTLTDVRIDLLDAAGELVRGVDVQLEPFEQRQLNGVFRDLTEVGHAIISVDTPGGSVWTYASVVDNLTGDPVFVEPP